MVMHLLSGVLRDVCAAAVGAETLDAPDLEPEQPEQPEIAPLHLAVWPAFPYDTYGTQQVPSPAAVAMAELSAAGLTPRDPETGCAIAVLLLGGMMAAGVAALIVANATLWLLGR